MRFFLPITLFIAITSCAESDSERDSRDSTVVIVPADSFIMTEQDTFVIEKSKWICHHPNTEFHNEECVEEEYPVGCYVRGNLHKFCWLLYKDECNDPLNEDMSESCRNVGYLR